MFGSRGWSLLWPVQFGNRSISWPKPTSKSGQICLGGRQWPVKDRFFFIRADLTEAILRHLILHSRNKTFLSDDKCDTNSHIFWHSQPACILLLPAPMYSIRSLSRLTLTAVFKLRICDAWSFILDQRSLHLLSVKLPPRFSPMRHIFFK